MNAMYIISNLLEVLHTPLEVRPEIIDGLGCRGQNDDTPMRQYKEWKVYDLRHIY